MVEHKEIKGSMETLLGSVPKCVPISKICEMFGLGPNMSPLLLHHLSSLFSITYNETADPLVMVPDAKAALLTQTISDWNTHFGKYTAESKVILEKLLPEAQKRYSLEYTKRYNEKSPLMNRPIDPFFDMSDLIPGSRKQYTLEKKVSIFIVRYIFFRVVSKGITGMKNEIFIKYHYRGDGNWRSDLSEFYEKLKITEKSELEIILTEDFVHTFLSGRVYSSWNTVLEAHKEGIEADSELYEQLSSARTKRLFKYS
ncbi:MAG: hypothetical protein Hyperionvirus4_86 [Hyperionvirus sp.]|uniref:Uncharacterized protein n=1 Tax=Hyperionvirus sp. TaxID=2487770 RepID=A0A3G5AA83_9VIRU|nr:MAG: hypothetical protein Hyperionvirus4_86 [Hyperionvirus sp.]